MKKITILLLAMLTFSLGSSQTFTDAAVHDMQNGSGTNTATCGTVDSLILPLNVSGIGTLDPETIILQSVTLNITHTFNADVYVALQDPSGATVLLIQNIGGGGDGFTDCILTDNSLTPLPTVATTPVTGTFYPLNPLSGFNGLDADGDWNLLVCDDAGGDLGTVDSWSLTFGATPPPQNNACVDATPLICYGSDSGNSDYANDTDGNGDADVWYSFDSSSTTAGGELTFSLCGSGFDTIMTVYDSCGGTVLDSNDDFCGLQSEVTIISDGVTNYMIKIEGYNGATGDYIISTNCPLPAAPTTVGTLNVSGCDALETYSVAFDASASNIVWLELIYDGGCYELTVDTESTTGIDTEIGLYADTGILIGNNDDGGTGSLSTFTSLDLPAGTYYVAVGAYNTIYVSGDFNATSANVTAVGNLVINASTPPPPGCAETPITPLDGETDVEGFDPITMSWTAPSSGPAPTSYDVYIGFLADGTDLFLFDNTEETTLSATVGGYNLTVYWTVVPKIGTAEAVGCTDTLWSFTSASSPGYCLDADYGQYPSAVFTPTTCDGVTPNVVTSNAWASEYAVVSVTAGQTYEFTSSVATDFITISDDDGATAAAYGTTPVTWTATTDGEVRFYTHTDDQCGAESTSRIKSVLCGPSLSVQNQVLDNLFTYYPNPVNNTLSLKGQKAIQNVAVYNMLGQEVLRSAPNTINSDLDMSHLNAGTYFVKVTIENATKTIKIIKR